MNSKNKIFLFILILSGFADALYLTFKHYSNEIVPCTNNIFVDCGQVLDSVYSVIFGIPLAVLGVVHYFILGVFFLLSIYGAKKLFKYLFIFESFNGFVFSLYLVFLQVVVIGSICLYCMMSAIISFVIFFIVYTKLKKERIELLNLITGVVYKYLLLKIFFLIDAETIHNLIIKLGKNLGGIKAARSLFESLFVFESKKLEQKISGISFENPIGLAAGFDYDADLTSFLPSLGLGFMTVGTVTNNSYQGNPKPRLGRLPKSKSLMVNKGFKNSGSLKIAQKLKNKQFMMPVGISIGSTNSPKIATQKQSVQDIISAFKRIEKFNIKNSYYELNISCPNLIHAANIDYYQPGKLNELLKQVDKIKLKKPVFIKMPINLDNHQVMSVLKVISEHNITGVIFGNLQKDRKNSTIDSKEADKFKSGSFSGKPTYDRSNELIELAYKNFGNKLVIIGCGGVFSGHDAYEKIIRGASLVQLITGLIYEGPQLVSRINLELIDIISKENKSNIGGLVGAKFK